MVRLTDVFLSRADAAQPDLIDGLYLHGSLCWGEFFDGSDIDFVATLSRRPSADDLDGLATAHAHVRDQLPQRPFEGFYCQPTDLARPPSDLPAAPVHFQAAFDPQGNLDVNPVTWHELAERGLVVRGALPPIHTDLEALLAFTRGNLRSYWLGLLDQIDEEEPDAMSSPDSSIAWVTLGVARLHHLLARRELTSKSGAGRYILETLDARWHPLATEALAIREAPGTPSGYKDAAQRGRDARDFLAWAVEDGQRLR